MQRLRQSFCVHVLAARWASVRNPAPPTPANDPEFLGEGQRKINSNYAEYIFRSKGINPPDVPRNRKIGRYPILVEELTLSVLPGVPKTFLPSEITCPLCSFPLVEGQRRENASLFCIFGQAVVTTVERRCIRCNLNVHYKESSSGVYNHDSKLLISHRLLESWRKSVHCGNLTIAQCITQYVEDCDTVVSTSQQAFREAFSCYEVLRCKHLTMKCVICGDKPEVVVVDGNAKLRTRIDHVLDVTVAPEDFSGHVTKDEWSRLSCLPHIERISRSLGPTPYSKVGYASNVPIIASDVVADKVLLTEFEKLKTDADAASYGIRPLRQDQLDDLLQSFTVKKLRDFCRDSHIDILPNSSSSDIIAKIRSVVAASYESRGENDSCTVQEVEMHKNFTRFNQTTGGVLTVLCPHFVCYYAKVLIRSEGNRDVFDALFSFKTLPRVIMYDNADNFVKHALNRLSDQARKFNDLFGTSLLGRVAEYNTLEISRAKACLAAGVPMIPDLPTNRTLVLYDRLHEGNSKKESALLRRVDLVGPLRSVDSIVAEKMNKALRKLVFSLNMMKPVNFAASLGFYFSDWNKRQNEKHTMHLKNLDMEVQCIVADHLPENLLVGSVNSIDDSDDDSDFNQDHTESTDEE